MENYTTELSLNRRSYDFEAFKFVLGATITENPGRYGAYKQYLHFDGKETIQATNGHVYHAAKTAEDLKPGFYRVVKNIKTKIQLAFIKGIEFPVLGQISMDRQRTGYQEFTSCNNTSSDISKIIRRLPSDMTVNIDYASNILGFELFKVYVPVDGKSPIYFEADELQAVLMPMYV